jgi:hypothetical protein
MSGERKHHASAFDVKETLKRLKRLLQGAVAGAVATMFVGFVLGRLVARQHR